MNYKKSHNFEDRINESSKLLEKYPDRIPIICERIDKSIEELPKGKFLVPKDLCMSDFMYVIRQKIKLPPQNSMYLFVANKLVPTSSVLSSVYESHKDKDGFLYIRYGGESTFGFFE
jgi:GABA(A) receptor-associated protein